MKYFVTGTDTDIGKTYVSSLIANAICQLDKHAAYIKPIQTGSHNDASEIKKCCDKKITTETLYQFKPACSPHLAIQKSKNAKSFTTTEFKKTCKLAVKKYENVIVEGAGGVFVPIYQNYRMADLIKDLDIPAILVARDSLGTLNHTLLSYEAMARRGIRIKLLIINQVKRGEQRFIIEDNIKTLAELTNLPVYYIPHTKSIAKKKKISKEIAKLL